MTTETAQVTTDAAETKSAVASTTTVETKTEETKTADATTEKAAETTTSTEGDTPKAPESYTLTVPDEAKPFVADDDLEFLKEIAKANDWTNEQAQAELDAQVARAQARLHKQVAGWEAETTADKDWGGAKLAETQKLADRGVDAIFPAGHPMRDRFLGTLKGTGGGVRLEIVAFLATLGQKVSEDVPAFASSTSARSGSRESKLYDHPTSLAAQANAS